MNFRNSLNKNYNFGGLRYANKNIRLQIGGKQLFYCYLWGTIFKLSLIFKKDLI